MKDSLLAVEDSRFMSTMAWTRSASRALAAIVTGGHLQGASTITQQVARTFFLNRSRSLGRKFKEACWR
jgi:penicillin-binding protein 1A